MHKARERRAELGDLQEFVGTEWRATRVISADEVEELERMQDFQASKLDPKLKAVAERLPSELSSLIHLHNLEMVAFMHGDRWTAQWLRRRMNGIESTDRGIS